MAPIATIVMPLLNHREWVAGQIGSLFDQWRPGLDLVVMDDGSTDGGFEAASAALASRPEIPSLIFRNEHTLGQGAIAALLRQTRGDILIQADSDDISSPERLDRILSCFASDPRCRLVTSNAILIAEDGTPIGLYDTASADIVLEEPLDAASRSGDQRWLGATNAFHRSLLTGFPPIEADLLPHGLDNLLPFRATLTGTHHYLAQPLVRWRQHGRNTHRATGWGAADLAGKERFGASELMVLAQKIRDAQHAFGAADTPERRELLERCHNIFADRFMNWARIRNALDSSRTSTNQIVKRGPAVPPIVTLASSKRYYFGADGEIGRIAELWPGIHSAESAINSTDGGLNWTARCALLAFRADPRASMLSLGLMCLSLLPSQRIGLSVNGGAFQEFAVEPDVVVPLTIPIGSSGNNGIVSIVIFVPDAVVPADLGHSAELRLLGACLCWLAVD